MFPTPSAVKTLRAYYKGKLTLAEPTNFAKELLEESDRATIILSSTTLEDILIHTICRHLVVELNESNIDYVFRVGGPLGTFSSRIELSYVLGFTDRQTRDQLDIIRELRNACAHSKQPISFATPQRVNVVKRLFKPNGYFELESEEREELRRKFIFECALIYQILLQGSREEGIAAFRAQFGNALVAALSPSPHKPPQQ